MKVEKKNNKYYVNDLDLEEVIANRKYLVNYIKKQIDFLNRTKEFTPINKYKLTVLYDIQKKMELRKWNVL